MGILKEWLQTKNMKLFVIMENNKLATISIERDIDTVEQTENIYAFCNDILNTISETGNKCYIKMNNTLYHIALAKILNLQKGDTFYITKT